MPLDLYQPDFHTECRLCGTVPCVIISGHIQPDTELCGVCFFGDRSLVDWALWNELEESTE